MPIGNIAKKRGKAKIKISSKRGAAMQRLMDSYSGLFMMMVESAHRTFNLEFYHLLDYTDGVDLNNEHKK